MARVTVEDCLKHVKNRFELVIIAARRARQLMRGKDPRVEWDNDKSTVVALREIAAGVTNIQNINLPESHSTATETIVVDEETIEILPTSHTSEADAETDSDTAIDTDTDTDAEISSAEVEVEIKTEIDAAAEEKSDDLTQNDDQQ